MVTAHNRKFEAALLEDTFAWSTFLNGLSAIASGISAHFAVSKFGLTGPFLMAGATTIFACLLIANLWDENYGAEQPRPNAKKPTKNTGKKVPEIAKSVGIFSVFKNGTNNLF